MRLLTFRHDGQERLGALVAGDAHVVDLQRASGGEPALASMQALIAAEKPGLQQARLAIEFAQQDGAGVLAAKSVQLLAPLPVPPQLRDFLCFEKHLI